MSQNMSPSPTTRACLPPRWLRAAAGLTGAALLLVAGCSTQAAGVSCSPGTTVVCSCQGALTGQSTCDSSGNEGACECGGAPDSSSGGGGSPSGAGSDSGGGEAGMLPGEGGAFDATAGEGSAAGDSGAGG